MQQSNGKSWEVLISYKAPNGDTRYARLEHRGRMSWCKRTAEKHAREFKAAHMRDAWAREVDE